MLAHIEYKNTDLADNIIFIQKRINRLWGSDYILMDSYSFRGGIGGFDYETMSNMFQNMWEVYSYRLFSNF